MLKGLLGKTGSLFGEKEPSEEEKLRKQQEQASDARINDQRLASMLGRIRLKDETGKISAESLTACDTILRGLQMQLENASIMVSDTGRIDESLMEIAGSVEKAAHYGNIETVRELLGMLNNGIGQMRMTLDKADEYEKMKRISTLEKQATLARLLVICDEIAMEVEKEDNTLSEMKESYQSAAQYFKDYTEKHPEIIEMEKQYLGRPGSMPGELVSYNTQKQRVVAAHNKIRNLKELKALNEISLQSRRQAVDTLRNELLTVANQLDPELLAQMRKYQEEFEEELIKIRKNNQEIDRITSEYDSMMTEYFKNPYFEDMLIATDTAYQQMIREEQKRIEARKNAEAMKLEMEQVSQAQDIAEHDKKLLSL